MVMMKIKLLLELHRWQSNTLRTMKFNTTAKKLNKTGKNRKPKRRRRFRNPFKTLTCMISTTRESLSRSDSISLIIGVSSQATWKSSVTRGHTSSRLASNSASARWIWTRWCLSMPSHQRKNIQWSLWRNSCHATLRIQCAKNPSKWRKMGKLTCATSYTWSDVKEHLCCQQPRALTKSCGSTVSKSSSRSNM